MAQLTQPREHDFDDPVPTPDGLNVYTVILGCPWRRAWTGKKEYVVVIAAPTARAAVEYLWTATAHRTFCPEPLTAHPTETIEWQAAPSMSLDDAERLVARQLAGRSHL